MSDRKPHSLKRSNTLTMHGDPFIRKRAVRYIAIFDQALAGFLLFYAAYRLVNYDFRDQSLIVFVGAADNVLVAIMYWLGVFALIGLQLVIAFLLLTGTKDMTTDPATMMKKCQFWRTFSVVLLVFLSLDFLISIYVFLSIGAGENQRVVSIALDCFEILFRLLGVFFVGKFITDLHSLFAAPMTTGSSTSSTPAMVRSARSQSMFVSRGSIIGRGSRSGGPGEPVILIPTGVHEV